MRLIRVNISLGSIRKAIMAVLKFIYKIIDFLNLQLALLSALIGVVLYFTGTFDKSPTVLLIFYVVLIASLVFALVATVRHLLGFDKKDRKERKKKDKDEEVGGDENIEQNVIPQNNQTVVGQGGQVPYVQNVNGQGGQVSYVQNVNGQNVNGQNINAQYVQNNTPNYQQPIYQQQTVVQSPQAEIVPDSPVQPILDEKPVYFTVKQNPNYVMAEYSDRFELFLKTKKGLQKVRVDYKKIG